MSISASLLPLIVRYNCVLPWGYYINCAQDKVLICEIMLFPMLYRYTGDFSGGNKPAKFPSCALRCHIYGSTDRSTGSSCISTGDVIPLLFDLDTELILIIKYPLITLVRNHTHGHSKYRRVFWSIPFSLVRFNLLLQVHWVSGYSFTIKNNLFPFPLIQRVFS